MRRLGLATRVLLVMVLVGALDWGLIGFFNFNAVDALLGGGAREQTGALSRFFYALVGLAGIGVILGLLVRDEQAPPRSAG